VKDIKSTTNGQNKKFMIQTKNSDNNSIFK